MEGIMDCGDENDSSTGNSDERCQAVVFSVGFSPEAER